MSAPTEPCLPQHHTYLERMRQNMAMALHEHGNLVDLALALLLVTRGHSRPTEADIDDAAVLAEQLHALNELRKAPGGDA